MEEDMPATSKKQLTVSEVAELLGIDRTTVWTWIKKKKLPATDISNPYVSKPEYVIDADDLQRYLEANRKKKF